jgi:hypothetical protein
MLQRRVAIVAVVVVVAAALSLLIRPPIKEPALSHQLIAMQRAWEGEAVNFRGGPGQRFSIADLPDDLQSQFEKSRDIDQENVDALRPLLERFGWPTKKLVGREAVHAAMSVVQRAADLAFKEFAIGLMQKAGADDNEEYARLVDQIAVMKGEPQTYGTQWTCEDGDARPVTPVKDPDQAAARRASVGLEPYEKFARQFCFRSLGGEDGPPTTDPYVVTVRP